MVAFLFTSGAFAQCVCNNSVVWNALQDLYLSTNGSGWVKNDRWLETGTVVCDWHGIQCDSMYLENNNLRGTLPASLSVITLMKEVGLTNNSLHGSLPPEYSAWTNLEVFRADHNSLTGAIPPQYAAWKRLTNFGCNNNNLSGTLPAQFSVWTNLVLFSVNANALTGLLPPEYRSWTGLESFYAQENRLSGSLPPDYADWVGPKSFSLGNNLLSGTLPPEYARWGSNLGFFRLHSNDLSGSIPPQYSAWTNMIVFQVHNNHLTGTLPPDFSTWNRINGFSVLNNNLEGALPGSYGLWTTIGLFSVSLNRLNGTLPAELSAWPSFVSISVDNNNFVGTIPMTWTGKFWVFLSLHNNRDLSGALSSSMSVPLYASMCNTSLCGSIPATWSAVNWFCQNISSDELNQLSNGNSGIIRVLPSFSLPTCSPTNAPSPPPTTASPITPPPRQPSLPGPITTASGLTTAALGANAFVAVVIVSVGGGSTTGSFVQVSGLSARVSARLRDCRTSSSSSDIENAVNDEIGSFVADNPTTLSLPGRLSLTGGTAVGNALLLFAAPPVAAALYCVIRCAIGAGRGNDDAAPIRAQFLPIAVRLHLVVYAWVLAPTAAAAAVLLADGAHGGGSAALGVFGLVVVVVPAAGITVAYVRSRPLKGKAFSAVRSKRRRPFSLSEFARRVCAGRGSWALHHHDTATPRGRSKATPGVVVQLLQHALSETLHGCVYPQAHVFLFDFAFAAAQGLLAGSALSPEAAPSCAAVRGLLWTMFGMSVCAAAFETWVRPRATLLDEAITLVMAVWTAGVALLSALYLDDAASIAAAAQAAMSLCCVALQFLAGIFRVRNMPLHVRTSSTSRAVETVGVVPLVDQHRDTRRNPRSSGVAACPPPRLQPRMLSEYITMHSSDVLECLVKDICMLQSERMRTAAATGTAPRTAMPTLRV